MAAQNVKGADRLSEGLRLGDAHLRDLERFSAGRALCLDQPDQAIFAICVHESERGSLDFARDGAYISVEEHTALTALNHEIGSMLGSMIKSPEKFLLSQ
jgi:hypothetical protein